MQTIPTITLHLSIAIVSGEFCRAEKENDGGPSAYIVYCDLTQQTTKRPEAMNQ